MTVQKDVTKNIYVGNGSTTVFPFTFECPAEHPEYIKVYIAEEDGTTAPTVDYVVDMDNKQITYPSSGTALAVGRKLIIMRELPLQQLMNLVNNGPFFAEDIETAFDECVMMMQQMGEKLGRSLMMPAEVENFDNQVPLVPGRSFRVSDDGKSLVAMENPESVLAENKAVLEEGKAARDETLEARDVTTKEADRAAASATNAADSAVSAGNSAVDAAQSAQTAAGYVSNVTIWNGAIEYNPPDVVMTADGSTYRCIKANVGTNPPNHPEYWAITASVEARTFEFDLNGDLTPKLLPITSHMWEVADTGEIMPIAMDDIRGDVYQVADSDDIDEMMKEE